MQYGDPPASDSRPSGIGRLLIARTPQRIAPGWLSIYESITSAERKSLEGVAGNEI
jgi:hypothetical protein